jgi:hypothetical protein
MKTYCIKFRGRQVGAIGITTINTELVKADTQEEAILKLYDKYEHISGVIFL